MSVHVQQARLRQGRGIRFSWAKLSLPIVLLMALLARLWYASINPLSYDETHNLMIGTLVHNGYAPYQEVYSEIGAFAILTMQWSAAFWDATWGVRTFVVFYGLVGIASLFWIVRQQSVTYATLTAVLASLFFAFNPRFFFNSTMINLETGAVSIGLASVALIEVYRARSAWIWVFLSGILFGLSLMFKVLVPYLPAVVGLQLLLILIHDQGYSLRELKSYVRLFQLGLLWVAGMLLAIAVLFLFFDFQSYFGQVIAARFDVRQAIQVDRIGINVAESLNRGDIIQFIPLVVGTLIGIWTIRRKSLVHGWIWVIWLVFGTLFLLSHNPMRPRHLVTIVPALAALSGFGVVALYEMLTAQFQSNGRWLAPTFLAAVMGLAIIAPLPFVEVESFVENHPARQGVIHLVEQTTAPNECLISKENRLHFLSGRLSTPHLSLLSTARMMSDWLSAAEVTSQAESYGCPVLVYSDTFDRLIPDLRGMAETLYALYLTVESPQEPGHTIEVFAVQTDTDLPPQYELEALLGDAIRLKGFDLSAVSLSLEELQQGNPLYLSTYWESIEPVADDYKLFLHLLDEQGALVAAYDHYPFSTDPAFQVVNIALNPRFGNPMLPDSYPATGMLPTSMWIPGNTLKETIQVPLPTELVPGQYTLKIGMYDETTMERLQVQGTEPDAAQSQILLSTIEIE